MKIYVLIVGMLLSARAHSQELFVFTEPASNMAAKSVGLRLNNFLAPVQNNKDVNYLLVPEVMVGISRMVMAHADVFFNHSNGKFAASGASLYAKYRLYSNDEVQKHFRVAMFGRYSFNNSEIQGQELSLYGNNTGWESGFIATKLLHKLALSANLSYVNVTSNGNGNKWPLGRRYASAMNATVSSGVLVLPKTYTDYKQTNLNLMLEVLSQVNTGSGYYYLDVAPAVQLVFNSRTRIDLGYRQQLAGNLPRNASSVFLLRVEYNLFNAF